MPGDVDVEDIYLNYDSEFPQQRFRAAGDEAALKSSTGRLPSTVSCRSRKATRSTKTSRARKKVQVLKRATRR
jgi:hypothetical protein